MFLILLSLYGSRHASTCMRKQMLVHTGKSIEIFVIYFDKVNKQMSFKMNSKI